MKALDVALDLMLDAEPGAVEAKSQALTALFIDLVEGELAGHGFRLITPRDAARRGSQVSFAHPEGYAIMQALIARGVIGDFRAPDILRFGFAPLYNRFEELGRAVESLKAVMEEEAWRDPVFQKRAFVT